MAEPDREDADHSAQKGGKKVLILIIIAFLSALAIGGGVTYFLISRNAPDETEEEEEVVEEKPKRAERRRPAQREAPPPSYVTLEAFTVNLAPENGDQFLHVVVSVEVADEQVGEKIKLYTPKLRNNVMLLLSSQKASELASREGKQKLSDEIRSLMNEVIEPGSGRDRPEYAPIREVLFTTFIIQ
jgi:flagellar FliL protein